MREREREREPKSPYKKNETIAVNGTKKTLSAN